MSEKIKVWSHLIRVPYGKSSTPKKDREYQLEGAGAVGTLTEWKKAYPRVKFKVLERSKLGRLS